ncbi:hypothetical protein [Asticcacaulis solisilvae]|uniref:hypothetical protein n=1 Tax=Asticcacaulis solisilvae TaxID=1217274 RepID=UPI003FD7F08C
MAGNSKGSSGGRLSLIGGIIAFIGTVISNRLNGIYYETFLKRSTFEAEYKKLVEHKYHHFIEIRSQQPTTRNIKQYVDLLKDEDKWREFETAKMNKYFEDKIELFPFGGGTGDAVGLDKPEDFFLIQMEMVRRRFPGGDVEGDIGDNDIRKLISCLRYVFRHNYFALIWARRGWALSGVAGAVVLSAALLGFMIWLRSQPAASVGEPVLTGFCVVLGGLGLCFGFLTYTIARKFKELTDEYTETVRHSCNVLARALEMRIQNIAATIPLIFNEIDKARFDYDNKEVRDLWPEEVKKWSKLAFWMAARVEHIELFLQAQMWRIRRIHYGAKSVAVLVSWLLLLLSAPALVLIFAAMVWSMPMPDVHALGRVDIIGLLSAASVAILTLASVLLSIQSYKARTPDIDLIEKTIQTNKMPRNHDVKLYDEVARFLYREKKALLNEEDKLSGKKP